MSATATTTTNLDTIGKIAIKFKRDDPFEIYDSIKDLRDSIRIRKKKRSKLNSSNYYFNYSYDDIHTFHCKGCHFKVLPRLPKRLVELDCSNNDMSKLPSIPKTVTHLKLENCKNVKKIKNLPKNLKVIQFQYCSVEKVTLSGNLEELYANNNKLSKIPLITHGLKKCYLAGNDFRMPYKEHLPSSVTHTDCDSKPKLKAVLPSYTSTYSSASSRPPTYSSARSGTRRNRAGCGYSSAYGSAYGSVYGSSLYNIDYGGGGGTSYYTDYDNISGGCDFGSGSSYGGGCDGGSSYGGGCDGGFD